MKLGVCVNNTHVALAEPDTAVRIARLAEARGFDSIWVNDHIVVPGAAIASSADRQPQYLDRRDQKILESTVLLSYLAGCTTDIALGTSVYVLALRNPVVAAKQLATLDVVSQGRLIVGVGVGWMESEFGALGVPWQERGPRTDVALRVVKALWSGDHGDVDGYEGDLRGVVFRPPPLQSPHPPIWIGGRTGIGARRAAELGDAWHPSHLTVAEIESARKKLDHHCEVLGRREVVPITTRRRVFPGAARVEAAAEGRALHGSPDEMQDELGRLEQAGVTHMVLEFASPSEDELVDEVEWFAANVLDRPSGPGPIGGVRAG